MSSSANSHLFPYLWNLADGFPAKGIPNHGKKVFGTFVCGGGSAMGYKLAGYDYRGGVELDKKVAEIYRKNLRPAYLYVEDLREFNKRNDLPVELYNLDILDGSPPCTLFTASLGKKRENLWGKEKKYNEGKGSQTLDDLPFVWIETVKKLGPKVALMENVEGLTKGNAIKYLNGIVQELISAGYNPQVFLLDAKDMGVPQRRRRVFVVAGKQELNFPRLSLSFSEPEICFGDISDGYHEDATLTDFQRRILENATSRDTTIGDVVKRLNGKISGFGRAIIHNYRVPPTLVTVDSFSADYKRHITDAERKRMASFPQDYEADSKLLYLTGMCVPPVMTAQISYQIYKQWLSKL